MYTELAHLYDWAGSQDFADRILPEDLQRLQAAGIGPGAGLIDLACGTGTLAMALAAKGYQVLGVDLSSRMLEKAWAKRAALPDDLQALLDFQQGDMRDFSFALPGLPLGGMDAVLCHYDSLNHLSNESELRAAFLQVSQVLRPGGLFVFDLNTEENFLNFWNGTDSDEGPNYRLTTEAHYDADSGKATVRFFADEHTDDGLIRTAETLHEQYFNEVAVEKYLRAAGFVDIVQTAFNPVEAPGGVILKPLWTARRAAD